MGRAGPGTRPPAGEGERGFALVAVLCALGLLSGLFLAFSSAASHRARLAGNLTLRAEARAAAESGLALAAAGLLARLLNRDDPAAAVPVDGSWRHCRLPDAAVSVSVQDAAGRVDLNGAGPGLLRAVFEGAAPDGGGRALLAAAERAREAARVRGGQAFRSAEDLAALPGAIPGLVHALRPFLTVWSPADGVAPEAADPALLALLARAGGPGLRREPTWRTYLVEVLAETEGGGRARLSAVVALEPGLRPPYAVLEHRWAEAGLPGGLGAAGEEC